MSESDYVRQLAAAYEDGFGVEGTYVQQREMPEGVPPIELALFPPTDERPAMKLVTMGMGAVSIAVPDEQKSLRVELSISLPPDWGVDGQPDASWPMRQLATWARFPFEQQSFVWAGHTLAGQPLEPMAEGTEFAGWMVVDPFFAPASVISVQLECLPDGQTVEMLDLLPLHADEIEFATEQGSEVLFERLREAQIAPMVVERDSVV